MRLSSAFGRPASAEASVAAAAAAASSSAARPGEAASAADMGSTPAQHQHEWEAPESCLCKEHLRHHWQFEVHSDRPGTDLPV